MSRKPKTTDHVASPELMKALDAIAKTEAAPMRVPITAEWLCSLGYPAFKDYKGEYSDRNAKHIYRQDDGWKKDDWWALDFDKNANGTWTVMLSAYVEGRFATLMQLADVSTQDDVLLLLRVLEHPKRKDSA